jgi:hypothetical protein
MSSHRHHRPSPHLQLTKVPHSSVSPDDIKSRMLERDRLAALDTRTDAQRWLGDLPPERSALARRNKTGHAAAPATGPWISYGVARLAKGG